MLSWSIAQHELTPETEPLFTAHEESRATARAVFDSPRQPTGEPKTSIYVPAGFA